MNTPYNKQEVDKFNRLASQWWDKEGPFKTLHAINPCRLAFIKSHIELTNKPILDIGCGGGILSESLAETGAQVTGIDMAEDSLHLAREHAKASRLSIDYQLSTAEEFALIHPQQYDAITCMELLEHVPDPSSLLKACAHLLKPHGHLFVSTLNRTPKSFAFAILGAEYLFNIVPHGTHHYSQFIRPSELNTWAQKAGLTLKQLSGLRYNPLTQQASLHTDVSVNYLAYFCL